MSPSSLLGKPSVSAPDASAQTPTFSTGTILAAFAIAAAADFLQLPLNLATLTGIGAVPSEGADLVIDAATAFLLWRLLGFHWILLPTLVLESVPFIDAAPSWLACVALVVWSHRRSGSEPAPTANATPSFETTPELDGVTRRQIRPAPPAAPRTVAEQVIEVPYQFTAENSSPVVPRQRSRVSLWLAAAISLALAVLIGVLYFATPLFRPHP